MKLSTLSDWLNQIQLSHEVEIALGLERVQEVAKRLSVLTPPCPVIVVGGTNGKGSTVAGLEAIYRAAGYRVGAFTTPMLFRYNEQVRLNGQSPQDETFCEAFAQIEAVRGDIPLTPFEYGTLAALLIFKAANLEVWILEVGLGGRLDAVNILATDLAIVTNVSLDHMEWLGDTRDAIAFEKAGIYRPHQPAIYGEADIPITLKRHAQAIKAHLYCQAHDYHYEITAKHWHWYSAQASYTSLPPTPLLIQNMANVLMAITLLQSRLPVPESAVHQGFTTLQLPGRIQVLTKPLLHILDVAHNPAAISRLNDYLMTHLCAGKTLAVFSMLADKDMLTSIKNIQDSINKWYIAPLTTKRTISATHLQQTFTTLGLPYEYYPAIQTAYQAALDAAHPQDRIVIFGSFHTVAEVGVH